MKEYSFIHEVIFWTNEFRLAKIIEFWIAKTVVRLTDEKVVNG